MKYAAIIGGLILQWSLIASAVLCGGIHRWDIFVFPFWQWWEALFNFKLMLWMPDMHHIAQHPLIWFINGFLLATLITIILSKWLFGPLWSKQNRQPNIYGSSEFADRQQMSKGGITSEKR